MVTFAKAIYDKNSIIIGVLGIDISIKNIQAEILGVHFLETGYAILCERFERSSKPQERIVVSAPDFQKRVKEEVSLKDVIPDVTGNAPSSTGCGDSLACLTLSLARSVICWRTAAQRAPCFESGTQ